MVKGFSEIRLNQQTVALAIQEYINSRLKIGVNIKVTDVYQADESEDFMFVATFKEQK
jgi:hypothetical protein